MTLPPELRSPGELTRSALACSRCGIFVSPHPRRLGLLLDGGLTVERRLCHTCLDDVLIALGAALRPYTTAPDA